MPYDANNTYATLTELEQRLTVNGLTWCCDQDDFDTERDAAEAAYAQDALEYANVLADQAIVRIARISPRPANDWLKGRVVDIAAYRIATLGGRAAAEPLRLADEEARALLEEVASGAIVVPGLVPNLITANGYPRIAASYSMQVSRHACGRCR
jgi:hypothetical protein